MREVVIVKALRTAIGSFGGTLKDLTAPQLAAVVIRRILEETNLPPEEIDGHLRECPAGGCGPEPRPSGGHGGGHRRLFQHTPSTRCAAPGLKAVGLAAQAIRAGDGDVFVVGGMESMSTAPYAVPKGAGEPVWAMNS